MSNWYGVRSREREDGSLEVELLTEESFQAAAPKPEPQPTSYPSLWDPFALAMIQDGLYLGDGAMRLDVGCTDPIFCDQYGCLCKLLPGETFHCSHCIGAYDNLYQCQSYPGMCVGCCGHDGCRVTWNRLVDRTAGGL